MDAFTDHGPVPESSFNDNCEFVHPEMKEIADFYFEAESKPNAFKVWNLRVQLINKLYNKDNFLLSE